MGPMHYRFNWCLAICLAGLYCGAGDEYSIMRSRQATAKKKILRIVTIQKEPFMWFKWEPGLMGNERYQGYYADVISNIAQELRYDYKIQLVADGEIGTKNDDGDWNGMIGDIVRKTADVAAGPIIVNNEREVAVDFTVHLEEVKLTIVLKKQKPGQANFIRSLTDLVYQSEIKYGVIRGGAAEELLRKSQSSVHRRMWQYIYYSRPPNSVANIYEGLERVRRESFALILEEPLADYYILQQPCDLTKVDSFLGGNYYAFAVKNDSDLRHDINRILNRMHKRESQWDRLKARWWRNECASSPVKTTPATQVEVPTSLYAKRRRVLSIIGVLTEPYLMRKPGSIRGHYVGYLPDLIHKISEIASFDYHWKISTSGRIGKRRKGGKWDGLIGDLLNGEGDIAAAPLAITRRRSRILKFSKPYLHSTISILMKSPVDGEVPLVYMNELLNQTSLQFGIVRDGVMEKRLRLERHLPYVRKVIKHIKSSPANNVASLKEGLKRIRESNYALLVESTVGGYLTTKQPCDLLALDQFLATTYYGLAVKRGNDLVDDIDEALLELQEQGVLQILFHRWWNDDECSGFTSDFQNVENMTSAPNDNLSGSRNRIKTLNPRIINFKPIIPTTTTESKMIDQTNKSPGYFAVRHSLKEYKNDSNVTDQSNHQYGYGSNTMKGTSATAFLTPFIPVTPSVKSRDRATSTTKLPVAATQKGHNVTISPVFHFSQFPSPTKYASVKVTPLTQYTIKSTSFREVMTKIKPQSTTTRPDNLFTTRRSRKGRTRRPHHRNRKRKKKKNRGRSTVSLTQYSSTTKYTFIQFLATRKTTVVLKNRFTTSPRWNVGIRKPSREPEMDKTFNNSERIRNNLTITLYSLLSYMIVCVQLWQAHQDLS